MNYLIIGNKNACIYERFFRLFKNKKISMGYTSPDGFLQPDGVINYKLKGLCRWYTNLEKENPKKLVLSKKYNPSLYPKYDNYDAINVNKVIDIPVDYYGAMGVPITILEYDLKDFNILGIADRNNSYNLKTKFYTFKDTPTFNDLNPNAVIRVGDKLISKYARVIIQRNEKI